MVDMLSNLTEPNQTFRIVDLAVAAEYSVKLNDWVTKERDKYQYLTKELKKLWN